MGTGPCTWNGNGINLMCASHEGGTSNNRRNINHTKHIQARRSLSDVYEVSAMTKFKATLEWIHCIHPCDCFKPIGMF